MLNRSSSPSTLPQDSPRATLFANQVEVQQRLVEKLKRDWDKFGSEKVAKIDRTDGLKMIREDGSWVLMRLSGTEPVVRVYCEADSPEKLARLVESAKSFVFSA